MSDHHHPPQYRTVASMPYEASSWQRAAPHGPLTFDHNYRLAHLPILAPRHPLALGSDPRADYTWGRYTKPRLSLVVPVAEHDLASSPIFQAIDAALRDSPFASKVAWDLLALRRAKLHVTLCGLEGDAVQAAIPLARAALERLGPLRFRLGGPYVGTKNVGRIYFPAYPEKLGDSDCFAMMLSALGRRSSDFYLLGYYNLIEELTEGEANHLRHILSVWSDATLVTLAAERLAITATHDDLVLDSRVHSEIALEKKK